MTRLRQAITRFALSPSWFYAEIVTSRLMTAAIVPGRTILAIAAFFGTTTFAAVPLDMRLGPFGVSAFFAPWFRSHNPPIKDI